MFLFLLLGVAVAQVSGGSVSTTSMIMPPAQREVVPYSILMTVEEDMTPTFIIGSEWQICRDPSTPVMALADRMATSDIVPTDVDGFPWLSDHDRTSLYCEDPAIYMLVWSDLNSSERSWYETAYSFESGWAAALTRPFDPLSTYPANLSVPGSYVISFRWNDEDPSVPSILLAAHDERALQWAAIDLIRDGTFDGTVSPNTFEWFGKKVLNYPDVKTRVMAFR